MICNLDLLGNTTTSYAIPPRIQFSKTTIMGNSTIDEMHLHNTEITDSTILATNTEESFGADSLLLAHYQNNTMAGNYTGLATPIASYNIMKRKIGDSTYTLVKNVTQASGITSIKDYTSANSQQYEYIIIPVDSNGITGASSLATVISDFWGWFLISQDNSTCYKFDLEINSDTIQIIEDFKVYENYTENAVTSYGKRQYVSGKLTTIPYTLNGQNYVIDVSTLNKVKAFINNKQPKYLKNTAGEIYLVSTHNFSYKYYDNVSQQPYTISFEFIQVGTV